MTMDRSARIERTLPVLFDQLAEARTPDYLEAAIERASSRPQRAAWTFPERWLPVELVTTRVPSTRVPMRQLGVLALLALLLATMLAIYSGATRLPEPYGLAANGLIVYSESGDIYARDAVGSPPRLLVGGPEIERIVAFSRQGNQMLFAREQRPNGKLTLWVSRPDGTGIRQLDGSYLDVSGVEWSPAGDAVAVTHSPKGRAVLSILPSDGSAATDFDLDITATEVAWRPPDGSQLSFRGKDGHDWGLYLINRDGSGLQRLAIASDKLFETEYDVRDHRWSSDGARLMYDQIHDVQAGNHSGLRIHIAAIAPDGAVASDERFEFEDWADDELNASFLPGTDRIVYQRRRGNEEVGITDTLKIVRLVDGAKPVDLGIISTAGDGVGYEVSPDGTKLISILWGEKETYVTDLTTFTTTPAPFVSDEGATWQRRATPLIP
jgi:dipeptidyl aminopeptidase/acylaminoacyl peptidase